MSYISHNGQFDRTANMHQTFNSSPAPSGTSAIGQQFGRAIAGPNEVRNNREIKMVEVRGETANRNHARQGWRGGGAQIRMVVEAVSGTLRSG